MGEWFAGVCTDLADDAVRGVHFDVVPLVPGPPPSLARTWVAQFDADYPALVGEQITRHLLAQQRLQERRDRNTAMLLWGVHL